jgi:hypothetical protein
MSIDKVSESLEQFVNTEDWDEARKVLEENRDLLSDQAVEVLAQSAEDYRESGREEVANYLQEHLNVLLRSREVGIEEAFREANQQAMQAMETRRSQLDELRPASPTPLQNAVWALLDAETPEDVDRALSQHPELSQDEQAVTYLNGLIQQAQDASYAETVRYLQDYRDLLQAFFELPPLMVALQEFMSVPTWTEAREVLERNPDLLSDESLQTLDSLIGEAENQGDHETASTLSSYRQVIVRAREAGPEHAIEEVMEAAPS